MTEHTVIVPNSSAVHVPTKMEPTVTSPWVGMSR